MVMALSNSFLEFILEPNENETVYKDYVRGPFTIKEVPYKKYSTMGPDGEETYIPGDVMLRISELITEMYNLNTNEIQYK